MNIDAVVKKNDMPKEVFESAQEIYTRAYNAGKSDAILEFVEIVKKDIGHMKFIGNNDFAIKREIEQVINKRMREVIDNTNTPVSCETCKYHKDCGVCDLGFMCINNSGWVAKED